MWMPLREYLKELKDPPMIGPGLHTPWSPKARQVAHVLFTTLRYLSFYLFFRPLAWLICNAIADLRMQGKEYIPHSGEGGLATSNHLSMLDPVVTTVFTPRPVYVMVKAEYFKTLLMGGAVSLMGGFPVRRGEADRQAVKTALSVARRGGLIAIYPEGTRSKTFKLQEGHPGAALVASSNDVQIWPMGIWGSENIMRRNKLGLLSRPRVNFVIGKPYKLKEEATAFATTHNLPATGKRGKHDDLDFLSDILMLKIADLLPSEYRGEFNPENVVTRYYARVEAKEKEKKTFTSPAS